MHLSAPARGRTHDMNVLKQSRLLGRLPQGSRTWGDRGYTGLDKQCPGHEVIVPRMRPKGGTLSPEDRELNHQISKVRITVENVVCKLKEFRVCRKFYRNDPAAPQEPAHPGLNTALDASALSRTEMPRWAAQPRRRRWRGRNTGSTSPPSTVTSTRLPGCTARRCDASAQDSSLASGRAAQVGAARYIRSPVHPEAA
ncbi:hypothetical protein GCM10010844_34620 [Deinococcus radiotolerans]|uniref:DDE Tnp4 domain-containing protein n=1 Tax=Deinococcus radiotolerans TaxID=1309407 RepID=A0ABQ2FP50_9DEIO|nr:hypothetical protein GCM10010844_34620 [Deinococcus radiotolerans]